MTQQHNRNKNWYRDQAKRKDRCRHLRLYRLEKLLRAMNEVRGKELNEKGILKIWRDHGKGGEHRAILLNFFEVEFIKAGNHWLPKATTTHSSPASKEVSAGVSSSFHCHVQLSNGGLELGQGDKNSGMVVRGVVQEGTSTSNTSCEDPQNGGL